MKRCHGDISMKDNQDTKIHIILKKGCPIGAQIADVAEAIKKHCPDLFKKTDPYPTLRMVKFNGGEITYEITRGKSSSVKAGLL